MLLFPLLKLVALYLIIGAYDFCARFSTLSAPSSWIQLFNPFNIFFFHYWDLQSSIGIYSAMFHLGVCCLQLFVIWRLECFCSLFGTFLLILILFFVLVNFTIMLNSNFSVFFIILLFFISISIFIFKIYFPSIKIYIYIYVKFIFCALRAVLVFLPLLKKSNYVNYLKTTNQLFS